MNSTYTIFATNTCPYCKQARDTLEALGFEVEYIILTEETLSRYLDEFPNAKTVPQIITPHGEKISGYDDLVKWLKD